MARSADTDLGRAFEGCALRPTANRRAILDALNNAGKPITVNELADALRGVSNGAPPFLHQPKPVTTPGMPQSSLYRNLSALEAAGLVVRVIVGDEFIRYELDESLAGHHHHLLCEACGVVVDVELAAEAEASLSGALAGIAAEHGFEPREHRLDLIGICVNCQGSSGASRVSDLYEPSVG